MPKFRGCILQRTQTTEVFSSKSTKAELNVMNWDGQTCGGQTLSPSNCDIWLWWAAITFVLVLKVMLSWFQIGWKQNMVQNMSKYVHLDELIFILKVWTVCIGNIWKMHFPLGCCQGSQMLCQCWPLYDTFYELNRFLHIYDYCHFQITKARYIKWFVPKSGWYHVAWTQN